MEFFGYGRKSTPQKSAGPAAALQEIMATRDPEAAQRIGRQVRGFSSAVWRAHAEAAVQQANAAKFSQNPRIGDVLLNTGQRPIAEASRGDTVWGIGLSEDDPRARDPDEWYRGTNLLGKVLMRVRGELRASSAAAGPTAGRNASGYS